MQVEGIVVVLLALVCGFALLRMRRDLSLQRIESDRLRRITIQMNRETTMLSELSELLQSCRSLDEAHRLIADRAALLFPESSGAVCVPTASRDILEVPTTWGKPSLADDSFASTDCWGLRQGRMYTLREDSKVLQCAHMSADRPSRAICAPMTTHGETFGLLYIDSGAGSAKQASEPALWTDTEQRLAKIISEQAAMALATLTLRDTLRQQAISDAVTGLYNRRYLDDSLERERRRADRKGATLGVMMLDVDHFKSLNDEFGHDTGDAVLRTVADVLKAHLRAEDIVCRYGGEEFVVLLPDASLDAMQQRAETLRDAAARIVGHVHTRLGKEITLSIGVATYPEHGATSEAVLRAADGALYQAKAGGRNRVVAASALLQSV